MLAAPIQPGSEQSAEAPSKPNMTMEAVYGSFLSFFRPMSKCHITTAAVPLFPPHFCLIPTLPPLLSAFLVFKTLRPIQQNSPELLTMRLPSASLGQSDLFALLPSCKTFHHQWCNCAANAEMMLEVWQRIHYTWLCWITSELVFQSSHTHIERKENLT